MSLSCQTDGVSSRVVQIKLPASNAYLVRGKRTVLVDAGTAASERTLNSALAGHGVERSGVAAVLLTHGHADHAGGAAAFQALGVPVLVGAADAAILEAGHNPPLHPTTVSARLYRPFLDRSFPPYTPDALVATTTQLTDYGIDGEAVPAPGHTPGSLVVHVEDDLIVGDLARGGHMGGLLQPSKVLPHYYSADTVRDLALLHELIQERKPTKIHVGHGGPLDTRTLLPRLERLIGRGFRTT